MEPQEYLAALMALNDLVKKGASKRDVDAIAREKYGMTYKALGAAVKSMPKEIAPPAATTKDLLRAQAYGASLGWLDEAAGIVGKLRGTGYARARDNMLKEVRRFEKEQPALASSMKTYGTIVPSILGGLAARGAMALGAGRGISAATLAGSDAAHLGAAGRAAAGAGVGAVGGAGGLLGEGQRMRGAAAGALIGAPAGAVAGASAPAVAHPLKKIAPWLGGGATALGGKKLLDYLTGN